MSGPWDRNTEKSTLWTDAVVDQNFQRDLKGTGTYEFQGKFAWTNPLVPCFQGMSVNISVSSIRMSSTSDVKSPTIIMVTLVWTASK